MEDSWQDLQKIETAHRDIIAKLEMIEAKRATVAPPVYEKVKRDYEKRLKEVEAKLSENIDFLNNEIANLKREEANLLAYEQEIRFTIEEQQLRYSIGEYDDETFKRLDQESKQRLKELTDKLEQLRARTKRFESFLAIKAIEEDVKAKEEVIKIEEHILLEELPEVDKRFDELVIGEMAVKEGEIKQDLLTTSANLKKGEKGVLCPKCGYLNTPDSWYCEKCGAEILAIPDI